MPVCIGQLEKTLPETNQCAPEKKPSQKWKFHLPTIDFQGRNAVSFREGACSFCIISIEKSQHMFTRFTRGDGLQHQPPTPKGMVN